MKDEYELAYADYRDEIPAHIVQSCIESKDMQPLWEQDFYGDVRRYYAQLEADKLESDDYDELVFEIMSRDISCPEKDAWNQSRIAGRITLFSDWDCWVPPYDAGGLYAHSNYLTTAMSILRLNPAKVKEVCSSWTICRGKWPNYSFRNGKEVVSYEGFSRILRESWNYGLLTFCGMLNMSELWDNISNLDNLVISKGTVVTMFNYSSGGGSLDDCETIRDISFGQLRTKTGRVELEVDERGCCRGYSTRETYGGLLSNDDLF